MKQRYWHLAALGLFLAACTGETTVPADTYFSLKTYMGSEAARLQKVLPLITKTVSVNGRSEQQRIKVDDWNAELAVFADADINKAAWRGYFQVERTDSSEVYTANQEKINVRRLEVIKDRHGVKRILIAIGTRNYLYQSADTLEYIPGKTYNIIKNQHIRLLQPRVYHITGRF